ncbi:uncharacterized protein OCT59_000677 [Rhizophagus irregularis]|uniref:uncharacterized protein n=1 Tax=Rhizophagus irregularis TaxID=588596 RepID=UPI00333296C5|nr:hypothetical protein OCT59_000677 [Rhizophagus irregularis]
MKKKITSKEKIDDEDNNVKRKDIRKNQRTSDGEDEDNNVKRKDLRKNQRISENEEKDNIAKRKNIKKYQQTSDDESAAKSINQKKSKDRRMYSESDDAEESSLESPCSELYRRKKNSPIESLDPEIFTFKVEALWKALDL